MELLIDNFIYYFMNTQEIGTKLVAYIREGKTDEAHAELYSDDIVSIENPLEPNEASPYQKREGMAAKKKFGQEWAASIKEIHDDYIGEPVFAVNSFAVNMGMDVTMQSGERVKMDELAIYRVKDGKIVHEEFWY